MVKSRICRVKAYDAPILVITHCMSVCFGVKLQANIRDWAL